MLNENTPRTDRIHDEPLSRMGRRQLTRTMLGLGFSATAATTIGVDDVRGAGSDEVPISIGLTTDEVKYVPADWYNDYRQADRINRRVSFTDRHDEIVGQWLVPGDYGGESARIDVEISQNATGTPRDVIPEQIEGVPIEVVEVAGHELMAGCHEGDDYGSAVPGGVEIATTDGSSGSMGPRVLNSNDSKVYFGTCQHVYDTCGSNTEGRDLYHPSTNDNSLGTVDTALNFEDFVAVDAANHTPQAKIAKPDSTPSDPSYFDITGSFSKDALSERKAAGNGLRKIGITTCQTFGDISKVAGTVADENPCTIEKKGQVQWGQDGDIEPGDSGAVAFAKENGNWYVASLTNGMSPTDLASYVFGTGIYRIHDKTGFYYG